MTPPTLSKLPQTHLANPCCPPSNLSEYSIMQTVVKTVVASDKGNTVNKNPVIVVVNAVKRVPTVNNKLEPQ